MCYKGILIRPIFFIKKIKTKALALHRADDKSGNLSKNFERDKVDETEIKN